MKKRECVTTGVRLTSTELRSFYWAAVSCRLLKIAIFLRHFDWRLTYDRPEYPPSQDPNTDQITQHVFWLQAKLNVNRISIFLPVPCAIWILRQCFVTYVRTCSGCLQHTMFGPFVAGQKPFYLCFVSQRNAKPQYLHNPCLMALFSLYFCHFRRKTVSLKGSVISRKAVENIVALLFLIPLFYPLFILF